MTCEYCGGEFSARIGTKFCKDACRRAAEKLNRRKPRPDTKCASCEELFTPARHGQKRCPGCRKKSDDLKLAFQRFLRNRDRTLRVWRSKSSRGIPTKGELKLPELPEDWRTSTQVLPHPPGTINPPTLGDVAKDFFQSRAARAGKVITHKSFDPPKQDWLPVWPKLSPEAEKEAWVGPKPGKKGKNRDAVLAYRVHKALFPFNGTPGSCGVCQTHISEEVSSNGGNEMRAKFAEGDGRWEESYGDRRHEQTRFEEQTEQRWKNDGDQDDEYLFDLE